MRSISATSRLSGQYASGFRNGYGKTDRFYAKVSEAAFRHKSSIIYRNAPGLTFDELRAIVVRAVMQHKVKGIILDYWQLVGGKEPRRSTADHLDEVAQWIADTGHKHKVWMLVAAQIKQEGNTRGGEGIRLAFDQVYQMHRMSESSAHIWMEMMDTRYTPWMNLGSKDYAKFFMHVKGPFFSEDRPVGGDESEPLEKTF
jgi:DnaB-like helicase C terminal domain